MTAMLCGAAFHGLAQQPAQPQPPTFRTNTSIVPIDVHVVDKDGHAVTDLTKADFTVTEDGVPQTITQFEKARAGDPAHPRWFVIVLGEGRIQAPFKSIDALEEFIGTEITQSDHIGVIAYNRWSDFTADHAATLAVLDRYKSANGKIQTDLETFNSGLRRHPYGYDIEDDVQKEIDDIFRERADRPLLEFGPPPQMGRMSPAFEARTRLTQGRFSDILHLYGAIEYLRLRDGEKHVVFLTEQGEPHGPRPSRLATTAADNRIALHVVQTGGFGEKQNILSGLLFATGRATVPTSTAAYYNTSRSAREVTEDTGGLSFFYTDLNKAFARIADAIRVDYLLGYVPTNENWHGEYRHVDVRVDRPGVAVIYRRGYDAVATPPPWNDRATMTDVRLADARNAVRAQQGIVLQLKRATRTNDGKVAVELHIEPSQVAFTAARRRHLASLDVSIWITDRQGANVGTITDRIDLQLTDESYAKLVKQNIVFTRTVPVTGTPSDVRAGVYDYDNDRVGAVSKRIQ